MIVAIDGPAGSGKSTVARAVARRLGIAYLDTGAMYRAVTWLALDRGIAPDDEDEVVALACAFPVTFSRDAGEALATGVHIAGEDVTEAIRTPRVDAAVSVVAREPRVRDAMVAQQRARAAETGDCVVEGRDIGTVVFPDAEVKVFLTASAAERARRRTADHAEAGHVADAELVREQIERRDRIDSTREASPLRAAASAVEIDTTGLGVDEVVDRIAALVREQEA